MQVWVGIIIKVQWWAKSGFKKNSILSVKIFVKFIYSEKATKFCKISILLLTGTTQDKSKVEILQNFVAFSEYMNFIISNQSHLKKVIRKTLISNQIKRVYLYHDNHQVVFQFVVMYSNKSLKLKNTLFSMTVSNGSPLTRLS